MYVCTYIYLYTSIRQKTPFNNSLQKTKERNSFLFLLLPPLLLPTVTGAPRLSLSFLRITRSVCSAPHVPCSVPLHGNPLSSQVSGLLCLLGFIHLWIMIVSFFFFNSCPLSSFCIFRETSFTIGGYPYLVINLNMKAFKDSPLVWGIVEVMKYLCSYIEILF